MQLRPYQAEAIDAINDHLLTRASSPLCVLPTASGKTIIFATLIRQWMEAWPATRVCILAHVMELLTQAEEKLLRVWPEAPAGIWSAGLGRKEGSHPITIAGIQSIYRRAFEFDPFDVLIIDEAHLVPLEGEGMYRRFVADCQKMNPALRVLGFTATPYRLDGGHIADPDNVLHEVAYEANVGNLIAQNYLCQLRSKATATVLDAKGVKIRQGDYVAGELERAVDTDDLVQAAVKEIIAKGADRKAWLIFCAGVDHAHHVARTLRQHGISTETITGETDKEERQDILRRFDAGELRAVTNMNCLTTGLDVTRIDLIALLRPTQSTSLYVQMVGRGFRLHPDKQDCLVLDFGQNVARHGPVDSVNINIQGGDGTGEAPTKTCPECQEIVAAAAGECPACGYSFPAREIKHEKKAAEAPILASEQAPWELDVTDVEICRHQKNGTGTPVLRVVYRDGLQQHSEWICLEHTGFPRIKAERWWRRRFGEPIPATVDEAMASNLFLDAAIRDMTERIKVRQAGRYMEVVDVTLKNKSGATVFSQG